MDEQTSKREEILRRGREAFRRKLSEQKRRVEDDLVGEIFVFPMNLVEQDEIHQAYTNSKVLSLATIVVVRAKDERGKKIFSKADASELSREWDVADIQRLVEKIQADQDDPDAKAIGKIVEANEGAEGEPGNS